MLEARTVEKEIERELTDEQRAKHKDSFDTKWEEEQDLLAEKAQAMSEFGKRLREIRKDLRAHHDAQKTGREKVTVECIEKRNERLHQVEYHDATTGKLYDQFTRAMTADERKIDTRQEEAFTPDGKQAKVKAKSNGKGANGRGGHEKPELAKEPLKASVGELAASKRHEAVAASARKKRERKAAKAPKARKGRQAEARA